MISYTQSDTTGFMMLTSSLTQHRPLSILPVVVAGPAKVLCPEARDRQISFFVCRASATEPLDLIKQGGNTIKHIALTAFVLGIVLLGCAFAQQGTASSVVSDQDINLLRKDLRSDQKQIIAANMLLTDAEAQTFWPLYDECTVEKTRINDTKLSVIKVLPGKKAARFFQIHRRISSLVDLQLSPHIPLVEP